MSGRPWLTALALAVALAGLGCETSRRQVLQTDESAVRLRSMQTRIFDTPDKQKMLRTVMATLQDLGFVIDTADDVIGSVTATKLSHYSLKMTVTVRPRNDRQLLVRASGQYNLRAVEDPGTYQDFFASLEKAIFLTAHLDEDTAPLAAPTPPAAPAPAPPPPEPATTPKPVPAKPPTP